MGKSSLAYCGEDQGRQEDTGKALLIIPRHMGSGMYGRCGSELERPYLPPEGKEDAYKRK